MKIVADENIPGLEGLERAGLSVCRQAGRAIAAADLADADALLIRSVTRVDEALLHRARRLRFVGTATSGFDHVDRQYLRARDIVFAHAPGANANSVVEYVLSAIAEIDEQLERLLDGGRVGIVGYGHIGQCLARRLDAMGIGWCVSDPWQEAISPLPNARPLADVLGSQVVTLHAELTDAAPHPSRHLLNAGNLKRLPEHTLLVNASRGPVIDNAALRERLGDPGAPTVVLDVWETEPHVDPALLGGVRLGSAHIAGYSWDGKLLATRMLVSSMVASLGLGPIEGASDQAPVLAPSDHALRGASLVRSLLAQRYVIAEDDRRLRAAVRESGSEEQCRVAFDRLRRDYRRRWELAGSLVRDPGWDRDQQAQAMALGLVLGDDGDAAA